MYCIYTLEYEGEVYVGATSNPIQRTRDHNKISNADMPLPVRMAHEDGVKLFTILRHQTSCSLEAMVIEQALIDRVSTCNTSHSYGLKEIKQSVLLWCPIRLTKRFSIRKKKTGWFSIFEKGRGGKELVGFFDSREEAEFYAGRL